MSSTFLIFLVIVVVAAGLGLLWLRRRKSTAKSIRASAESPAIDARFSWSQQGWVKKLRDVFSQHIQIDQALYQELEEVLVTADIGIETTTQLLESVRKSVDRKGRKDAKALREQLQEDILKILTQDKESNSDLRIQEKPWVLVMIGVNGVGKTTTIAKLAQRFISEGKKVLLAAGDTFRAAAVEQLKIWGERLGCGVIAQGQGNDPAAVAFDAAHAALARGVDILILDTAGRLHTKANLMEELRKIMRTLGKVIPGAPHEVWLVLDASTGQNALQQARQFHAETGGITGIVLTKMDGSARGGILIALAQELKVPVRFVGVGETAKDLLPFNSRDFAEALFKD